MATLIDWHAHHTPPELIERFTTLGQKAPRMDPEDSVDFGRRIADMDAAGVDVQLVCQGAGANGDRFPAETAMELVRLSNDTIANRIAPYADRLLGGIVVTFKDAEGSILELDRMAARGFRAVQIYASPEIRFPRDSRPTGDRQHFRQNRGAQPPHLPPRGRRRWANGPHAFPAGGWWPGTNRERPCRCGGG
jgi:predicted TIM-barrel fold metal-dependent hydrolase